MSQKIREEIYRIALSQVGVKESPAGSNNSIYGKWYENGKFNGLPWCAMFVSWVYDQANSPLGKIDDNDGFRYCPTAVNVFKARKQATTEPKLGDIVIFDWQNDKIGDHTGIFIEWVIKGRTFKSIEGNTGHTNLSNGGEVMLATRNVAFVRCFGNVLDNVETKTEPITSYKEGDEGAFVTKIQQALRNLGYTISCDGDFGPETVKIVKQFQKSKGLLDDGVVGPKTKTALKL